MQKCLENLRKSREKLLNRFRSDTLDQSGCHSAVKDVMTEEWNRLRKDNTDLPTCAELLFSSDDEEITYLNSVFEEIQVALQAEGMKVMDMNGM